MLVPTLPSILLVSLVAMSAWTPCALAQGSRSLSSIKKVFIGTMPNDLDPYLRAEVAKEFKGTVTAVLDKKDADGALTGFDDGKTGTGRHDNATGTISTLDKEGKSDLWSDEAADLSRDPRVVHAMMDAWLQAFCSLRDGEAGFSVDRDGDSYSLVPQPPADKQSNRVALTLTRGVTMALFHVHPASADPNPSPADRRVADTYGVMVYVIHVSGLYVYDPVSRQTTRLCQHTAWMKP